MYRLGLKRIALLKTIKLLKDINQNDYKFNLKDIYLYYSELAQSLHPYQVVKTNRWADLEQIEINGTRIYWPNSIDPKDLPWLYHEIFTPFWKNPSSYDHPAMQIAEKDWIIDAGSAEGFFAIFCAERASPKTKILVVEPLLVMQKSLNMTLGQLSSDQFTILRTAIGNYDGMIGFMTNDDHLCDSKVSEFEVNQFHLAKASPYETVPIKKIDTIVNEEGLQGGQGLIKMDIEGFEMKALEGASEVLSKEKPSLAIAVYHEYGNAKKCAEIIRKANPSYRIEFRGCYGYFNPPRPYILFAY